MMYKNTELNFLKNHFLDRSITDHPIVFYLCSTCVLPMFYHVLPMFYLCSTCVLPFVEGSPMLCKIEIRSRHVMLSGAVVNIG